MCVYACEACFLLNFLTRYEIIHTGDFLDLFIDGVILIAKYFTGPRQNPLANSRVRYPESGQKTNYVIKKRNAISYTVIHSIRSISNALQALHIYLWL